MRALLLAIFVAVSTAWAPEARAAPAEPEARPTLNALLGGLVPVPNKNYGLVLENLQSGSRAAVNEDQVFPSASLYKLALAWVVLGRADAGALDLNDQLPIEWDDAVEDEPEGGVAPGDALSVREAMGAMLSRSSNAAAHALLRTLGRHEFNQEMGSLGLNKTRVPDESQLHDAAAVAVTSAADVARLLRLLATSQGLSQPAREELLRELASATSPDALRETLPEGIGIFDKTGNLEDVSNVAALLESPHGMCIVVVLDQGVDPGDARGVIAQVGLTAARLLLPEDQ
jgi:beta-lactamase class A